MHREHDPNEWTDWTARLFPVGTGHPDADSANKPVSKEKSENAAGHHHQEHDRVESARIRDSRRNFQNRLAQFIALLMFAEILIWLTGLSSTYHGWWSPARWGAILGTIWTCYGVLENLLEGRIGADLALAQAALAALFLREDFVAAEVVLISLVGEWLEDVAYQRARRAIGKLIEQAPETAWVKRNESWIEVPAGSVVVGELVAVDAGQMIPVDGVVESGRSSVDASSLTGESIPVDVSSNDRVACGQINQFGRLEIRADRVGLESTLGQVVKLMTKAQTKKAKLERMADRYARYFLPAVETAALITLIAGFAMNLPDRWLRAVAVLVVACPCSLVLATPATILAAWATLARRGVLVKSGAAIEQLALCDTLVFDKTGTLTLGEPTLSYLEQIDGHDTELTGPEVLSRVDLSSMIVALERTSPHPLAKAVVTGLNVDLLAIGWELFDSVTHPGAGISGHVRRAGQTETCEVLIGNVRLMTDRGIILNDIANARLSTCDEQGETPLLVAINGRIEALISLSDPIRPEAHDMVHDLKHLGFTEIAILTGDRPGAANRVGREVDVKQVLSEMTPTAKAGWIQDRLVAGRIVAMVGDGINDAPALAVSRVGLAVSKVGANLAAEAGDIILMHDPLRSLVHAREVSQAAVKILRQNILWFAFGLNGLAVMLAGLGILSPVGAAIFHQIGSLAVLCNALRILAFDQLRGDTISHRAEHLLEQIDQTLGQWARRFAGSIPGPRFFGITTLLLTTLILSTSGIYVVKQNQVLVRFRSGKFLGIAQPGLYLGRPWPLEEAFRIEPYHWWSAKIGRELPISVPVNQNRGWSNVDPEATPSELWLTGDGQFVEMTVNLQTRPEASPENLARLVTSSEDPTSRVSATAEATLRQFIAGATLDDLMTDRRKVLLEKAESSVKEQLKSEGLILSDLILVVERVQPPWSVLDSWRDSARALREAERIAIETSTSQELLKTETSAEIERLQGDSRTDAERIRLSAKSRKSTFESLVKARLGHPNLSDHRMFWSQLAEVLRNQPKVLLDTPAGDIYGTNAPKRHLIMPESPFSFGPNGQLKSSESNQRPGDSIPAQTTTKPGTEP